MTMIDKAYDPQSIEQKWYETWEKQGLFSPRGEGKSFSLLLPPPNVTGSLHMGHGFGSTVMDILIRYHRMLGDNTHWQAGTDHAGIATQMVVERQLNRDGKTRHDLGREKFVEKIWEWKKESGGTITQQFRRLGTSMDWTRERFTLDDDLSQAVREVFIRLYEEGLIYRGVRLANWDPSLLTAISDLEVISEEEDGHMWHLRYPIVDSDEYLVVATTRPETMLGDVAVAVHPDDERYQKLIGKHAQLPLTERTIPIIADTYVDPLFGTGCVKITPAHDFNDYAVGTRHKLTPVNIFTPEAKINDNAPANYRGMDRFVARKQIIKDLEAAGLLEKTDKHKLKIPRCERTGVIVEPYLTQQWFMKMKPLAEPAIAAVKNGDIKFIPENWNRTYFQWMDNIEDWCISRQLWWGHRIPVWYDDKGNAYVGQNEADVRGRHQLSEDTYLQQEEDVLDTWFSSALWPFSSLGWPNETKDLEQFFPSSVLVTGFDIIFFWVARMIMMSLKFKNNVPFKDVYITGLIRDHEGHKMSKSKGNVLDPIDLIDGISLEDLISKRTYGLMQPGMAEKIEKNTRKEFPEGISNYGTDALRFTFCSMASFTREIRFDISRLGGYRNFCNKIWNATRYVQMNTDGKDVGLNSNDPMHLSLPDVWILSRLQKTIADAHSALADYRFDFYAQLLYDFAWNEFCDWYLELSKPILTSPDSSEEMLRGTRHTLVYVLKNIMLLLHPVMPFITEEIWQQIAPLTGCNDSIMLQTYPQVTTGLIYQESFDVMEWLKSVIIAIRTIRSEMNISPAKKLSILLRGENRKSLFDENNAALLKSIARIESIEWLDTNSNPPPSATAVVTDLEIFIPLAGFINPVEESMRLKKEIGKLEKEHLQLSTKLGNAGFTERAPADVVEKERAKFNETHSALEKLKIQLNEINNLA
jgi:valyl-tRNA synthetase